MNIDKWLSFEDTNKGMEVIKQKDLDYYTDVFSPWQTKQKLKLWREVEWSAWWVKVLYFSFWAWTPLWVYNFTWFWFKPSSYIVQAWYASTASAITMSYASYINWAVQGFLAYGGTYAQMTTRMLAIYNWSSNTRANHSDLLDDWIALDFIENSESVKFTITAYK